MSLADNKKIAESFHLEVMEKLNFALADKIIDKDCVFHIGPMDSRFSIHGPQQAKRLACNAREDYKAAYKFIHSEQVAEGTGVAYRWKIVSTATKEQPILSEGIDFVTVVGGKITGFWSSFANPADPNARKEGWQL